MLRSIPTHDNGQSKPTARIGYADLKWWEIDTLRGANEQHDTEELIAVTENAPGSTIRARYVYARRRDKVQRLIDAGFLEYVRHEIYPRGAQCDIYSITSAGRQECKAFYENSRARDRERMDDQEAKREAERRETKRWALTIALEEQFGGNYFIPSLQDDITESKTPFLNTPLPTFAPNGSDGLPITIREWLLVLWFEVLPDDVRKRIGSFLNWADAIGDEDAAKMFLDDEDDPEPPTYGNIGWKDDQDDDDTEGDMHSPYGRIS